MALSMAHDLKLHTATEPLTVKESEPLSLPYSSEDMEEVEYESLPTDNLTAHLLAGGVAGMMEHCAMYPVDCIKTRMMTLLPTFSTAYRGPVDAFFKIIREENPRVLFRGIGVVAGAAGPAHAMYFSSYEFAKKTLSSDKRSSVLAQGGAGAISSLIHDGFMNPIEVVKQRLQLYHSPYKGAFHCIRTVYRTEGIKAFYRSYTTQLSMNVPFQVVHFVTYESFQDKFNPTRHYNPLSHMLSGAGAGGIAAAITTPLDVAKTFLNTYEQRVGIESENKVPGMVRALVKIHQVSGIRGYFKGLSARVIYQVPSTALCWSVYELFKQILGLKQAEIRSHSDQRPS